MVVVVVVVLVWFLIRIKGTYLLQRGRSWCACVEGLSCGCEAPAVVVALREPVADQVLHDLRRQGTRPTPASKPVVQSMLLIIELIELSCSNYVLIIE